MKKQEEVREGSRLGADCWGRREVVQWWQPKWKSRDLPVILPGQSCCHPAGATWSQRKSVWWLPDDHRAAQVWNGCVAEEVYGHNIPRGCYLGCNTGGPRDECRRFPFGLGWQEWG